jgi:hypothetical protein
MDLARLIERMPVMRATTTPDFYYCTAGSASWQAGGSNRLGFFNTQGASGTAITPDSLPVNTWQLGTHVITGTPGTDVCDEPHVTNVRYLTTTTMSVNGGGSETINDTNLADNESSFRWHFNDGSARTIQNVNIYVFNNTTPATRATGMDVAMYIKGNSMSAWQKVNDDTTTGPTGYTAGSVGGNASGNITGSGLDRGSAATDQYWYAAASISVETAGAKSAFGFGASLEYV